MENTTRIVDLPDNSTSMSNNSFLQHLPNESYPTQTPTHGNQIVGGRYSYPENENIIHQRLPSKDIHIDNADYMQDPHIKPNYIPMEQHHVGNYIPENKVYSEDGKKSNKKVRFVTTDSDEVDVWNKYKIPIFVCILFFVFHLPLFNRYMKEYLPISYLYDETQLTTTGILLKSLLFGGLYYVAVEYFD